MISNDVILWFTGSSDPYVEVLLMPEDRLNVKAVKTDYIKASLNPYYQKEFNMLATSIQWLTPTSLL